MIPALPRYVVHHVRTTQRHADPDGRLLKHGNLIDTARPGLVASFVYDMDLRLATITKVVPCSFRLEDARRALHRHYATGHHTAKKPPRKPAKAHAGTWTPATAPKPLPAPRITRMSA